MSVGSVAGLPMTSRQMSIQVCWAVVGEMVSRHDIAAI